MSTKSGEIRKALRVFQVPKINFEARSYYETINWQGSKDSITYDSPLMLRNLTTSEMEAWATKEDPEKYSLLNIPCHSQAVERHVKLVSDASLKSCSVEGQNGRIRATKSSRAKIPKPGSKKDYVCHRN